MNAQQKNSGSTQAGSSYSLPAYVPVQLAEFLYDKEVCGSQGPEEEGSIVCNTTRQMPDPVWIPPRHLASGACSHRFWTERLQ